MRTTTNHSADPVSAGEANYREWSEQITSTPEGRAIYEEESAKMDLWLQLVEARQATGLTQEELAKRIGVTQSQVARIEKRGYDAYTLNTLRRYVEALGDGYSLQVSVVSSMAGSVKTDSPAMTAEEERRATQEVIAQHVVERVRG